MLCARLLSLQRRPVCLLSVRDINSRAHKIDHATECGEILTGIPVGNYFECMLSYDHWECFISGFIGVILYDGFIAYDVS